MRLRLVERSAVEQSFDTSLLALARREALCRLDLGRLAAAFLARSGHRRLGFARLGDYSRERLGLSGREVQALASVASRLASLPAIEAAFFDGNLNWSQVRLLAAVATPDREAQWLERARGKTVRELLAEIGGDGGGASDRGGVPEPRLVGEIVQDEAGAIEGEESVRVRVRCPARVRVLWRRAVELARRMLGAQAPVWQAAEAIAAEGSAAAPSGWGNAMEASRAGAAATGSPSAPATNPDTRVGVSALARSSCYGELPAADVPVGTESVRDHSRGGVAEATGCEAGTAKPNAGDDSRGGSWRAGGSRTAELRANRTLETSALSALDASTLAVSGLGDSTLDVSTVDASTLDAFALDERMRAVVRVLQGLDAEAARCLRGVLGTKLFRTLGFASFETYVRERLGMSPSRAWALVRVDRRGEEVPALARAFRRGELSCVRLQTILPVASGTETDRWIRRAREVTVRQLALEVEQALDAEDLQMCARPGKEVADGEVAFCAPASVAALFRDAVGAFTPASKALYPCWTGLERLLRHVIDEWSSQPRHRDPVFERDGWRCAVPACSSRRNLHDHHRQFRSRGGTNERSNRVTTCAWHHLRGIHGGLVAVDGTAPDGLTWRLGLRPGREALLVFDGDRYRTGQASAL